MALSKREASRSTVIVPSGGTKIKASIAQENISHILSRLTNLYDDPVEASVREILSNAFDATEEVTEAERKPVAVFLPSTFEPHFVVEDYACGMSLATVTERYANYGATSKAENLNAIGSHGLGGKAPLAYTDNFSVETTHEGVTTKFIMQKVNGEVETTILSSEETQLPSGTKVTIPVAPQDMSRFEDAVNVYRQFNWRIPVEIDDELFQGSDDYVELGNSVIYLDEKTELKGTVRVLRKEIHQIFNGWNSGYGEFPQRLIHYELGGWIYGADGQRYDGDRRPVVIEIMPAVVDFSSSRDAITVNEKLKTLNKLVNDSLKSPESFEKLFSIFRGFDDAELKKFSGAIQTRALSFADDEIQVKDNGSRIIFSGSVELMTTEKGLNPYFLRAHELFPSVKFAIGWVNDDFSQCKAERQSLFGSSVNSTPITTIKALSEEFSETAKRALSYYAHALYSSDRKLMLVTGTTNDSLRSLLRRRDALESEYGRAYYFAFTEFSERAMDKKDLTYARSVLGDERLEIMSMTELIKKLEPARKALAAAKRDFKAVEKSKILDKSLSVQSIEVNFNSHEAFLEHMENKSIGNYEYKSLIEMAAHGNAVLFATNSYGFKSLFTGAVNAGHDFIGKTIFLIGSDVDYAAAQWNYIAEIKEQFYMSIYGRPKLKLGQEIQGERGFAGRHLTSVLKQFSKSELVAPLLSTSVTSKTVIGEFLKRQENLSPTLVEYLTILNDANSSRRSNAVEASEAKVEIISRYGTEELMRIDHFNKAIYRVRHGGCVTDRAMLAQVLDCRGELDKTPLVTYAIDYATGLLIDSYNAQLAV